MSTGIYMRFHALAALVAMPLLGAGIYAQSSTTKSCGPTATEIFHLRTECGALGKRMRDHMEQQQGLPLAVYTYIAHYAPESNRCYVKLTMQQPPDESGSIDGTNLYDAQSNELLANTGRLTKGIETTEWGHIGAEEVAYGHAVYAKVQAFIDDHVREK